MPIASRTRKHHEWLNIIIHGIDMSFICCVVVIYGIIENYCTGALR